MEVKDLVPVDFANQRVLLTVQLADKYGCTTTQIKQNFNNAKAQFVEGVHYFKLTGTALRDFKDRFKDTDLVGARARSLYLWTAAGIFLHAKFLNTPKAWALFNEIGAAITAPFLEQIIFGLEKAVVPEETACLYAAEMSDLTVKIGATGNFEQRKNQIQCDTKLQILRSYHSDDLPRARAFNLETKCHAAFADRQAHGELFNITFEEAVDKINSLIGG